MKQLYLFVLVLMLLSCSNGDIEIPSFDFSETINQCNENTVLFKLGTNNSQEALIITLETSDLPDEARSATLFTLTTNRTVTYRLFNATVGTDYFCQNVPPLTPEVVKDWQGTSGSIQIETVAKEDSEGNVTDELEHFITLVNLVLTSNGDTQRFESLEFGSITTTIPSAVP